MEEEKNIKSLTHKIINCAMEVHNQLGNGFKEIIYQRSLAIELGLQGINYDRELELDMTYKGNHIGNRRADFFIEEKVMVEIKAKEKLEDVHKAQALSYCEAYNISSGLLINFGGTSLEFKRVYNERLK